MRKKLTVEQEKKFVDLYLKGYSALLIFRELGQGYKTTQGFIANTRMRSYRIKLRLPKRGIGFAGITLANIKEQDPLIKRDKMLRRIAKINQMIQKTNGILLGWYKEKTLLKNKIQTLEREQIT